VDLADSVAEVQVAAVPAAVGSFERDLVRKQRRSSMMLDGAAVGSDRRSMGKDDMSDGVGIPEDKVAEFVRRMREAAGTNLEAILLFGSAATGEYQPEASNLNLFCVVRDTSFGVLKTIGPVVKWWSEQKQPAPMLMTRAELERSTDVFTIELLDMQRHHRVLYGEDVIAQLDIPKKLHRVQVEYELREKLVLLRQTALLAVNDDKRLWEILTRSVSSFVTLFRHSLIALGETEPETKRAAVARLATRCGFDGTAFETVLDVREKRLDAKKIDVKELFARYLASVEHVTNAVDQALEP
jgi:hypothetical protein